MTERVRRIPATVLTGFLGAGKTTLLRRVLSDPAGMKIGVLVNDFGEINIDAALIVEGSTESVSLSNGCVCCTIQTELVDAVRDLVAQRPDLDRIMIEASGVSRSLPLSDTLQSDELADVVSLDGVFCLVDAAGFDGLDYTATELAIDQITGADMLLLTKTDLVSAGALDGLRHRLAGLAPGLRILDAAHGEIPDEIIFGTLMDRAAASGPAGRDHHAGHDHAHDHHHHAHGPDCGCAGHAAQPAHADAFASWSWASDAPLDAIRFRSALRRVGTGLLRAKGLVTLQVGGGELLVHEFQQVGRRSRIEPAPGRAPGQSTIVAIALRDRLDEAGLAQALTACRIPACERETA